MILRKPIGGRDVVIECEESLGAAAADVINTFEAIHRSGSELRDGLRIRFGWSVLTLRLEERDLRVCEPAFDGNPFEELHPAIDTTLRVLISQVGVLRRVNEKGADVSFEELVLSGENALTAPAMFLRRRAPSSKLDSGWFVGDLDHLDDAAGDRLKTTRVFELLHMRPEILPVLALPEGYTVLMRDGNILDVIDAGGVSRWE